MPNFDRKHSKHIYTGTNQRSKLMSLIFIFDGLGWYNRHNILWTIQILKVDVDAYIFKVHESGYKSNDGDNQIKWSR